MSDAQELDQLYVRSYEELRRIAARVQSGDAGVTLCPTALVNEAWIKLSASRPAEGLSRSHFQRVAARAMRQVLVEAARRRNAVKRGGGMPPITFDEELQAGRVGPAELTDLDAALDELAAMNPRHAAMVEARFFGGLGIAECAALLGVSEATLMRDWRVARAWLARRLSPSR